MSPARGLLPVLSGAHACLVCHGPVTSHPVCALCRAARERHGPLVADAVAAVATAAPGSWLGGALWRYKSGPVDARSPLRGELAELLAHWLERHGSCLRAAVGALDPWMPVMMPSRRRHPGPLLELAAAAGIAPGAVLAFPSRARDRWQTPLTLRGPPPTGDVLLLDDTWTTGRTAQSAAAVLKGSGARTVAVLALGRHVAGGHPGGATYLATARRLEWDPATCCLCAPAASVSSRSLAGRFSAKWRETLPSAASSTGRAADS